MKELRCIDPKVGKLIGHYGVGGLKGAERERFEIHLISCTYCFNEIFQSQPIIESLRGKSPTVATQIQSKRPRPRAPMPERLFSLRDSRQWAGLVLLFLFAVAVVIYVYIEKGRRASLDNRIGKANSGRRLQNLSPSGLLERPPSELRWSAVPSVAYYQVEIFDEKKNSLWKKETRTNSLPLPNEVRTRLRAGHTYTWEVRGILQPQSLSSLPARETSHFAIRQDAEPMIPLRH